MANYPSGPVTFPARSDGQTIFAQHVQLLQDEIAAIEAGLLGGLQHNLWGAQGFTLSGVLTPPPIGTNQNDYAPAGLSVAAVVRQSLSAPCQLTGLLAQASGRLITIVVFGMAVSPANVLTIKNQSTSSAATNMILCPGATDLAISMGGSVTLWYDTANSFWRVIAYANPPVSAAAGPTYIGAKVFNASATVALTAATYTTLSWVGTEFNAGPMWAAGSPTRLTVPAGQGGHYLVYGKFQNATNANVRSRIMKNGAVITTEDRPGNSSAAATSSAVDMSMLLLNAGDYVEFQAYTSVAGTIGGTAKDDQSEFGAYRLNPV
jgi:hypothetical protein